MIHHIARRGLEHGSPLLKRALETAEVEVDTWAAVLLAVTMIASMVAISLVRLCPCDALHVRPC